MIYVPKILFLFPLILNFHQIEVDKSDVIFSALAHEWAPNHILVKIPLPMGNPFTFPWAGQLQWLVPSMVLVVVLNHERFQINRKLHTFSHIEMLSTWYLKVAELFTNEVGRNYKNNGQCIHKNKKTMIECVNKMKRNLRHDLCT